MSAIGAVDTSTFRGTDTEFQDYVAWLGWLDRWRRRDLAEIGRRIQEHRYEMGRAGQSLRLSALLEQLEAVEDDLFWDRRQYEASATAGRPFEERAEIGWRVDAVKGRAEWLRKEISAVEASLCRPQGETADRITPAMIERAKGYPIENLVQASRGMALCIFHDDRHPSMSIKNNFAHCFSCGKTADTIDVYRQIHGVSFPEAVRALS